MAFEKTPSLISTLQDVLELIESNVHSSSSHIKLKIVLNQQLAIMTESINSFLERVDQTSTEKIETIIQAITLLTRIINAIPNIIELEKVRLEFISISNFVRMTLANFSADSEKAKIISSASLLSHLLVGDIPHLEKLPSLPSLDEYTHFKEKFSSIFNSLQSTQAFYNSLLSSLNLHKRETLIKWFNEMIWHGKLLIQHYKRYPLKEILERKLVRNWKIFFDNLFTMSIPLIDTLYLVYEVFVKFGGEWPDEIDDFDLLRVRDLEGLTELCEGVVSTIEGLIEVLDWAVNNRLINLNDNPFNNPKYSILLDTIEEINSLIFEIKLHNQGLESITSERLTPFLASIEEVLESQIEYGGGVEMIHENFMLDQIISLLSYLLPYYALLSVKKNGIRDYESYLYKHSRIINFIGYEQGATFHFTRILSKIYVYSMCRGKLDIKETINELLELKDHLTLKPRELLMTLVLIILLSKSEVAHVDINSLIGETMDHVFYSDSHKHLEDDFKNYLSVITTNEPPTNGDLEKFLHRREYITFDINTLLIPDFEAILGEKWKNLLYVPFNRNIDGVY